MLKLNAYSMGGLKYLVVFYHYGLNTFTGCYNTATGWGAVYH